MSRKQNKKFTPSKIPCDWFIEVIWMVISGGKKKYVGTALHEELKNHDNGNTKFLNYPLKAIAWSGKRFGVEDYGKNKTIGTFVREELDLKWIHVTRKNGALLEFNRKREEWIQNNPDKQPEDIELPDISVFSGDFDTWFSADVAESLVNDALLNHLKNVENVDQNQSQ